MPQRGLRSESDVVEEGSQLDMVQRAKIRQLDNIDPSFTGLTLGDVGGVGTELVRDFQLRQTGILSCLAQGFEQPLVLLRVLGFLLPSPPLHDVAGAYWMS